MLAFFFHKFIRYIQVISISSQYKELKMARQETIDFFRQCDDPEAGCFATDPDMYEAMAAGSDLLVKGNDQQAAVAATRAGIAGEPFESVAFTPASLKITRTYDLRDLDGEPQSVITGQVVIEGNEQVSVAALERAGGIERRRLQIARCAFQCGVNPGCPLVIRG